MFVRVLFRIPELVRVAKHCGLSVVKFDFARVQQLVHAYSFPAVAFPQHLVQCTKQHSDMVLHRASPFPINDPHLVFQASPVPIILLILLILEYLLHILSP